MSLKTRYKPMTYLDFSPNWVYKNPNKINDNEPLEFLLPWPSCTIFCFQYNPQHFFLGNIFQTTITTLYAFECAIFMLNNDSICLIHVQRGLHSASKPEPFEFISEAIVVFSVSYCHLLFPVTIRYAFG